MGDLVTFQTKNRVAFLEIDHPPANTLSQAVLEALTQAVERVEQDSEVKIAVITGAGKFFVAGADIKEMSGKTTSDEGMRLAANGQKLFNRIESSSKPFIAAINGACLGGGLELAMACHLRYAASGAKLGQPEINLGLIPGFGGTQRLPRLIGQPAALEMLLSGEAITAEEAYALGLVNRVVPGEQLMSRVTDIAEKIAQKGRLAIREILETVHLGSKLDLGEGLLMEAKAFGRVFASEDKREGVAAFLEKRQPRFRD